MVLIPHDPILGMLLHLCEKIEEVIEQASQKDGLRIVASTSTRGMANSKDG